MTYEEILVRVRELLGEDAENTIKEAVLKANLEGYGDGLADGHTDAEKMYRMYVSVGI